MRRIENGQMIKLSQKAQRQLTFWASTPPRSGPLPLAMAIVTSCRVLVCEPQAFEDQGERKRTVTPWYLPRSRSDTTSEMMIKHRVNRPPPPTPWRARNTMS